MNARWFLNTVGWMVRDTFRQSLAAGIFWVLLGLSGVCILVCLSAGTRGSANLELTENMPEFLPPTDPEAQDRQRAAKEGVAIIDGELTLGFGAVKVPLARDARTAVHCLELILAGGVADTAGLLLTLIWTAGFLPGFLDRRHITVLLAKPAPRWWLLAGKFCGVLAFVLLHATIFVGGTWLALGLRTGVWSTGYFWAVPLLLLHFAIFFSFSLLLAVCTRSTVVCVFGSIAFWMLCWGMNYGRHALALAKQIAPESSFSPSVTWLADAGYWLLPKPGDLSILLFDKLDASTFFKQLFDVAALRSAGFFSLELSVLSSVAFMLYLLVAAGRQFATTDY
ncbi:MAG TPA: ABC transporter permease subunit [Pirellulales bacterium]|jgi:hypothetical protein|nr:ABC transporter permease subunit [Pirellulales bacterium]